MMARYAEFTTNTSDSATLASFIDRGKSVILKYSNFCMYNKSDNGNIMSVYNVLDDYRSEIEKNLVDIHFSDAEVLKYIYNPKRLSYDVYGSTDFYPFILWLNYMGNIKDFNFENRTLKMIEKNTLSSILSDIMNSEMNNRLIYNSRMGIDV